MNWNFHLPVELVFGSGTRHEIKSYIEKIGGTRGVLVCGKSFLRNGTADAFLQAADGALVSVFSDIRPNPTTGNVNACAAEMRRVEADFAVALGGGSPMDCCKAACAIARGTDNIEPYHNGDKLVTAEEAIPMIAFATTAGTASEVTNISVLTNVAAGVKKPMNHPAMYPKIAVVDPELTLTVPPQVTASTGLDVLCRYVLPAPCMRRDWCLTGWKRPTGTAATWKRGRRWRRRLLWPAWPLVNPAPPAPTPAPSR